MRSDKGTELAQLTEQYDLSVEEQRILRYRCCKHYKFQLEPYNNLVGTVSVRAIEFDCGGRPGKP